MHIFVTGASGYIGNTVAKACARAGHKVIGLVRSEAAGKELQKHEICPHIGDLSKPTSYEKAAAEADVLIHCAYEMSQETIQRDLMTIETLIKADPEVLIYTSGVWVYGNQDRIVDEATVLAPLSIVKWRPAHEEKVLGSSVPKAIVIRPGHVYGYGGGLIGMMFEVASKGALNIAGDGENYWSMVHVEDLAHLYLLALENGGSKAVFNATDSAAVKVKEIAEAVTRLSRSKIRYLSYEESFQQFGLLAKGLMVNQQVASKQAAQMLGWHPRHNNFLAGIEAYWNTWKAIHF